MTTYNQRGVRYPWEGGECPIDGRTYVTIVTLGGNYRVDFADCLSWKHCGDSTDIIAFEIVEFAKMTDLYDATEVNASLPKPADKVWAMYDGPFSSNMNLSVGQWYEAVCVYRFDETGHLRLKIKHPDASFTSGYRQVEYLAENWRFHVGPTPPDERPVVCLEKLSNQKIEELKANPVMALQPNRLPPIVRGITPPDDKAQPMQALADLGQQFDADGWIPHDGSAKRPKGVGKRDLLDVYLTGGGNPCYSFTWAALKGAHVVRYRISKRAEKRRKIWVVESEGLFEAFDAKSDAEFRAKDVEGTLYTAKLKKVK